MEQRKISIRVSQHEKPDFGFDTVTGLADMDIISMFDMQDRLNKCRSLYFFEWVVGKFVNAKDNLEHVSVWDLLKEYDENRS